MKKIIASLTITTALALSASYASAAEPKGYDIAGVKISNPFDASTWYNAGEEKVGEKVEFNPADPEFWMNFINPKEHTKMYSAAMDPASYGQFLKPITYVKMFDLDVWKKWIDLNSYEVLVDPQTYAYWMQPGAYSHLIDFDIYAQVADPAAYEEMVDDGLSTFGYSFTAPALEESWNPIAWVNSIKADSDTVASDS